MSDPGKHPHFDDRDSLAWYARFDDAFRAAREEGKKLFIELGREL